MREGGVMREGGDKKEEGMMREGSDERGVTP